MKDFNFFSPYLNEKRNKQLKKLYIIAVCSIFAIGLISFTAINIYQIIKLKSEIGKVESYLGAKETIELLKKYEDTKKETDQMKAYYEKIAAVDTELKNIEAVSTELLDQLSSVLPKDAFLLSLSINSRDVELQYSVDKIVSAAEIEHNLKALDIFETVHINIVTSREENTINVSCMLKDVKVDEADK
ncbi:MAG: PilN domain-containing protein [Lutisporaceae bacterium]